QGITFHSGAELTAEAVKANLDYILDPDNAAGTQTLIPDVTGVEVVDTYTLRITTAEPNPDLAAQLTDVLIADPSVFAEAGAEALNENPVGTGPYRVERWQRDTELVVAAYEGYWQGRPAIDRVIFRVIPDTQARLAALLNGEVDLVPGVPPEMIAQIEADPAVRIEEVPGRQVIYVGMNLMRPGPLSDRRVRQALNYAVDANVAAPVGIGPGQGSGGRPQQPHPGRPGGAGFPADRRAHGGAGSRPPGVVDRPRGGGCGHAAAVDAELLGRP